MSAQVSYLRVFEMVRKHTHTRTHISSMPVLLCIKYQPVLANTYIALYCHELRMAVVPVSVPYTILCLYAMT